MLTLLAAAALQAGTAPFQFDVRSGSGLTVSVDGVSIVRGSWFQFYEPDWSRGYYSSLSQTQTVRRIDEDTVELSFRGERLSGKHTYRREGNRLRVRQRYEWEGDRPVKVETAVGMLWAPAYAPGTVAATGGAPIRWEPKPFQPSTPSLQRRIAPDAPTLRLEAPFATTTIQSSMPLTLFDAANYGQEWAIGKRLWWLGHLGIEVAKDRPAELEVIWTFEPAQRAPDRTEEREPTIQATTVERPVEERPLLLPKPRTNQLDYGKPMPLTLRYRYPAGRFRFQAEFDEALKRRFGLPPPGQQAIDFDAGVAKLGLTPGGYRITIGPTSISVIGEEDEGLRNGLRRLAQLAFVKDGRLWLPTGLLLDQPELRWRGVHLFVGPTAVPFHKRLWERVLLPLGFNKAVIQCEQTEWDTLPGTRSPIAMPKLELARLFDLYNGMGVEPIPLIQSFGHMEWFFRNGQNLDLAFNRETPYTLDVRKPEARQKLAALWQEAATLLKPKTIHFGCDEVDTRGFPPGSAELVTRMWEQHLPFLADLAKKHGARMMIWGDNALAPGEAPDAAHGVDKEHALRRRSVLPKGTMIADWHYKADPKPETFYPTLQLWKREGFVPVASTWYQPANIYGFAQAAILEKAGLLQTTWAGYESSEENMLRALHQFSAMVLAGEYAWSRRGELPDKLGYDPAQVFTRMYFGEPMPVQPLKGFALRFDGGRSEVQVGSSLLPRGEPVRLRSLLRSAYVGAPTSVRVPVKRQGAVLTFGLSTVESLDDGEEVGTISVRTASGVVTQKLIYGRHVRADTDDRPTAIAERAHGISRVRVRLPKAARIEEVALAGNPVAGLSVHGLTVR